MSSTRLDARAVKARLTEKDVRTIYQAIGVERFSSGGPGYVKCSSPLRRDSEQNPSFNIEAATGDWTDHATGEHGDVFDAVRMKSCCTFPEAVQFVATVAGIKETAPPSPARQRRLSSTYAYVDETSDLLYEAVRYEPKGFSRRRPDGRGSWIYNLNGTRRVLYNLPAVRSADPETPIFVVEGEKDADRLISIGLVATTCAIGAGKWRSDYDAYLAGRRVVILPDNDDTGRRHAQMVARSTHGSAASVKVIVLPDLSAKGDVSDWLDAGNTLDHLLRLVEVTLDWTPETSTPSPDGSGKTRDPQPSKRRALTDIGNAERFNDQHGQHVRFVHDDGRWYIWTGTHWQSDTRNSVRRLMMDTARSIYAEAATIDSKDERDRTAVWAKRSESASVIRDALSLATAFERIAAERADFDGQRHLLNVGNGTLNLQTRVLRPYCPEDMLTRRTPVVYDPGARSALWEQFLADVTGEDDPHGPLRTYLQRAAGSCLAGWSGDEVLFFLFGPTQTGKSTFQETICAALDSYVASLNFDSLLRASTSEPRPDLVAVVGARIIMSNEMDRASREGESRLAASLIKRFTSGETIRVRNNYSNGFDWTPDAVLWLAANHAPTIDIDDEAMWHRVQRVPFTRQHARPDKSIRERLTGEPEHQAAVLAWLVAGWQAYQEHGLAVPEVVRQSTEAYRAEQNPMADFVQSDCVLDPDGQLAVADLNYAYERWCADQRIEPVNGRTRKPSLEALGLYQKAAFINRSTVKVWQGIRLRDGEV